jgi:hypothetical protein
MALSRAASIGFDRVSLRGEPDHQLGLSRHRGVAVDGQRAIERACEGDAPWPAGWHRMIIEPTDIVEQGRSARERLRSRQRATWDEWLAVGRAIVIGPHGSAQVGEYKPRVC